MADPGIPLPVEGLTEGQLELLRLKRTADIEECFLSPLALSLGNNVFAFDMMCRSNRLPCCAGVLFKHNS